MIPTFTVPSRPGVLFVLWRDVGSPDVSEPLVHYKPAGRRSLTLVSVAAAIEFYETVLAHKVPRRMTDEARTQLLRLREVAA